LKNGKLIVRTAKVDAVTAVTGVVKGKRVTSYVVRDKLVTREYELIDTKTYDMDGKRVDAKMLPKLLKTEVIALIAKDGRPVDPLHLRLIKPGTLLFTLPLPESPNLIAVPADGSLPATGAVPAPPVTPPLLPQ
jgi:hypothetical protein